MNLDLSLICEILEFGTKVLSRIQGVHKFQIFEQELEFFHKVYLLNDLNFMGQLRKLYKCPDYKAKRNKGIRNKRWLLYWHYISHYVLTVLLTFVNDTWLLLGNTSVGFFSLQKICWCLQRQAWKGHDLCQSYPRSSYIQQHLALTWGLRELFVSREKEEKERENDIY